MGKRINRGIKLQKKRIADNRARLLTAYGIFYVDCVYNKLSLFIFSRCDVLGFSRSNPAVAIESYTTKT